MARHDRSRTNRESSNRPFSGLFSSQKESSLHQRSRVLIGLFILAAIVFTIRLLCAQVFFAEDTRLEGEANRYATTKVLAHRGTIYDRNGNVLATSVEVKSVYCDPTLVTDVQEQAEDLVSVLGGTVEDYTKIMTTSNSRYVCVARKISVEDASALEEKSLDGFYYEDELERVYPYGETAGQIIGCLDSDGHGYTGLEKYYDDILSGTDGVQKAQAGNVGGASIPGTVAERVEAVDGEDIMLSIDIELQAYVESLLVACANKLDASSSNAVVMDGATGEIYAAASLPLFNPGDRSVVEEGATMLKVATSAFEPGSVFKTVSALSLLENDQMTVDTEVECPVEIEADGYTVKDAHDRSACTYSLRDIIAYSSNVGIALSIEDMGFTPFYEKICSYLLNEPTGVDYPDESSGYLSPRSDWSHIQGLNVSFGQGIMVTPLQITRFYAMLNNDGVAVTPHFLMAMPQDGEYAQYETTTVSTDEQARDDVISMLESVIDYGTATDAAIDGYDVAGKTSTAEIAADEGGYKKGVYNLAFCGFLPNSTSNLVTFVAANDVPYQTSVSYVFKDIMTYAIERYKISPK